MLSELNSDWAVALAKAAAKKDLADPRWRAIVAIACLQANRDSSSGQGNSGLVGALAKGGIFHMSANGRPFAQAISPKPADLCPFCGHNARHAIGVCYASGRVNSVLVAFAAFLTDKKYHICRKCCEVLRTTAEVPADQQVNTLVTWLAEQYSRERMVPAFAQRCGAGAEGIPEVNLHNWLLQTVADGKPETVVEILPEVSFVVQGSDPCDDDPRAALLLQRRLAERARKEALADARCRQEEAQRGGPRSKRNSEDAAPVAPHRHSDDEEGDEKNAAAVAQQLLYKANAHQKWVLEEALKAGCPTAGCKGEAKFFVGIPAEKEPGHPLKPYAGRTVCPRCQEEIHGILTSEKDDSAKAKAIRCLQDEGLRPQITSPTLKFTPPVAGPAPTPTTPAVVPTAEEWEDLANQREVLESMRDQIQCHLAAKAKKNPPAPIATPAAQSPTEATAEVCWICQVNPAALGVTRNGHPSCETCARINGGVKVQTVCTVCGGEAFHYPDKLVIARGRGEVFCTPCYGKRQNSRSR